MQKDTAQWSQPLKLTIHYQLHICTVLKPITYPMYRNLKKHLREISGSRSDKTVLKVMVIWVCLECMEVENVCCKIYENHNPKQNWRAKSKLSLVIMTCETLLLLRIANHVWALLYISIQWKTVTQGQCIVNVTVLALCKYSTKTPTLKEQVCLLIINVATPLPMV